MPSGRWTTVWATKSGYVTLNAFVNGVWTIQSKGAATTDDPLGIVRGTKLDGTQAEDLDGAMRMAEAAALEMGAVELANKTSLSSYAP